MSTDAPTVSSVNIIIYFLRFTDLSINTQNQGENKIRNRVMSALAQAITVDRICAIGAFVAIISVIYLGKNKVTILAEKIVLAKSNMVHARIVSDKNKTAGLRLCRCIY